MNAQHTPGPWHTNWGNGSNLTNDCTIWADCTPVAEVLNDTQAVPAEPQHDESIANARIIAAAPELLAALIDCVDAIESSLGLTDYGNTRESDWPELASARAAIAKAKGGPA